jgi:FMN phosphatase YigB (HAD superfamily)
MPHRKLGTLRLSHACCKDCQPKMTLLTGGRRPERVQSRAPELSLASFDVFETCLVRSIGAAQTIPLLLGLRLERRGKIACTPEAFARARLAAEERSWQRWGLGQYTLAQIYQELQGSLHLDEATYQQFLHEEYQIERELLRPVRSMAGQIARARVAGQDVAFISDTYLSSSFIREQLQVHGIMQQHDRLFVSCEANASKHSGTLFAHVRAAVTPDVTQIQHCGNHFESDVRMAQRSGIRATLFSEANLNRYETLLEEHSWSSEGLSSILAGLSRQTRLGFPVSSAREAIIRDVTAGVVAPALVGYVLWTLERARRLGLRRLYFVARDGQVLLDIARRLVGRMGIDCELRYLHGSRHAWWLPSVTEVSASELEWIYPSFRTMSLADVLGRLQITTEEANGILRKLGWDNRTAAAHLSRRERERLRAVILEDTQVTCLIAHRAQVARSQFIRYLQQEGLLDDDRWAIVDVGWWGSLYSWLGKAITTCGGSPPRGFYFGVNGGPSNLEATRLEGYMYDCRFSIGYERRIAQIAWCLIDVFCTSVEGQTMHYGETQVGQIVPVLRRDPDQRALEWGLPLVRQVLEYFVERLPVEADWTCINADIRAPIADVLETFWHTPTYDEASVWGAFPRESEWGTFDATLANPYPVGYVFRRLLNDSEERARFGYWKAGSIMLSSPPQRLAMRAMPHVAHSSARLSRRVARGLRELLNRH